MLTKDKIIEIFCFIDDLLKTSNHYEDSRQVSDSEVITTAVVLRCISAVIRKRQDSL